MTVVSVCTMYFLSCLVQDFFQSRFCFNAKHRYGEGIRKILTLKSKITFAEIIWHTFTRVSLADPENVA